MVRWVVAGVLLALLIALIVMDELAPTREAGVAGEAALSTVLAGEAPVINLAHTDVPEKLPVDGACRPLTARLIALKGEPWVEELGERLFERIGQEAVATMCPELGDLTTEEAIQKLEAIADGA